MSQPASVARQRPDVSMPNHVFIANVILVLTIVSRLAHAADQPRSVQLSRTESGWSLDREGQSFRILGAGGTGSLELLAHSGANSIRTWGVDDRTPTLLDEAQRLGLSVTVGIWLGHDRHGFDYSDYMQVSQQIEQVRSAVKRFRNHPAVCP